MDISFDIQVTEMTSLAGVKNIKMEGKLSQNFDLGFGFDFMKKKRVTFVHFLKLDFLDFIKQKLKSEARFPKYDNELHTNIFHEFM